MKITSIHNVTIPVPPDFLGMERSNNPDQVHVTQILNYIDDVLYGTKSDDDFASEGWDSATLCELGFTWERLLELAWGDRLGARCGELVREGIVGSPDGIRFDPRSQQEVLGDEGLLGRIAIDDKPWVIEELKCSWQSSDKAFIQDKDGNFLKPKWQRFINQAKSYCCLWGDGYECNRVSYHVLFVNGNYKNKRAHPGRYDVEFTPQELHEWWLKMKQIRDRLMEKKK